MHRRLALALLPVLCACESPKTEEQEPPEPLLPAPTAAEIPKGALVRTSRETDFSSLIEDLAQVEFVYMGSEEPAREAELLIVRHLHARGRLHAIGLDAFPASRQAALDEYSFGRTDEEQLVARVGKELVNRHRELLAFAREQRLPVIALGAEPSLRSKVAAAGLAALTDEERRSLPAVHTGVEEHRARWAARAAVAAGDFERFYEAVCLAEDVMADGVVRWSRQAPPGAQMAILTAAAHVAESHAVPERVRDRIGKRFRAVILLRSPQGTLARGNHARAHADYVWVLRPAED
jgi:uncharacterized iron-regulated protein